MLNITTVIKAKKKRSAKCRKHAKLSSFSLDHLFFHFDGNETQSSDEKFDEHLDLDCDVTAMIVATDDDGDSVLSVAIIIELTDIALALINLVTDYSCLSGCNKYFQTPLHLAVLINDRKLVRRLVVAGALVRKQDWRGDTPLHIACKKGFYTIAEALLTPVKYSECKQNNYQTPYQKIPQNLEIRNGDGLTCFLIATNYRDRGIMDLLLKHGADVNAFDMKSGKTSLHIVAESGDTSFVSFLTTVPELDVNKKTYAGYTALQMSRMRGRDHAEYLLLCANAQELDEVTDESDSDSDSTVDSWIHL